jgi:hypothetical protein
MASVIATVYIAENLRCHHPLHPQLQFESVPFPYQQISFLGSQAVVAMEKVVAEEEHHASEAQLPDELAAGVVFVMYFGQSDPYHHLTTMNKKYQRREKYQMYQKLFCFSNLPFDTFGTFDTSPPGSTHTPDKQPFYRIG